MYAYPFNAYIAGLGSGAADTDASFVLSTTGNRAKQWVISWGDNTQDTTLIAPDPNVGFTTPQTVTHHYGPDVDDYAVSATVTSIIDTTTTAVLAENAAFTGGGTNGGNGKEVSGLGDNNSTGSAIAVAADTDGTSYVLSVDGKRMAVTRFTPTGQLATTWASGGTYVLPAFTNSTTYDIPKAMTIDKDRNMLYVAGTSNNKWAVARVNIDSIVNQPIQFPKTILTGTPNAVCLDSSDTNFKVAFAGTNSSGQIQMAVLWAVDTGTHAAGDFDTSFGGGTGTATASNAIYGVPFPYSITSVSASAIIEADDDFLAGNDEEFFVAGTVAYCCGNCTPNGGSDMVIVDFLQDGTTDTSFGNGSGAALYNTAAPSTVVGASYDSSAAMVGAVLDTDSGTVPFLTLVGVGGSTILSERFTTDGARDTNATTGYGVLSGGSRPGFAWGPAGTTYAATRDPSVNKVVVSGANTAGNDYLVLRLNNDGALDGSFGLGGILTVDFGPTNRVTNDFGRAVVVRTIGGVTDILVAGYTYDVTVSKYKIALVDLLDDNSFHVT